MSARTLYLVATSVWFLAFGMQSVTFAWLVTIVLREPAELVGWAQTALLLPGMLLILLAGALADRIGPDRQALWAQLFATLTPWILIVALEFGLLTYPIMILYAVLMGCAQAFVTPARDGLLNHVAGSHVQRTVLLTSFFQFGCQIIGYIISAFADEIGAQTVMIVQSLFLLAGVLAFRQISKMGVVAKIPRPSRSVLQGVLEGAKTIAGSPVMRIVVVQNVAMACFFMGSFIVGFPLVVREVFDGSSGDLGLLNAFNSAGLVLTIVIMLRVGYVRRAGRALILFQALGSIVLVLVGMVNSFPTFVLLVFCWGLCGGVAMPMSRTLMQELAPQAQRSRVMSFYAFSFMGAGPLGTLFCGYLSELFGPQVAIQIAGVLMFSVTAVIALTSQLWRTDATSAAN
ncbi:MAG: MFS transporter [Gammaproteobacteria bacterium]|jgi:MFS family permease|nr:MFS transporter [Gammaproteobacteria bacterium]